MKRESVEREKVDPSRVKAIVVPGDVLKVA